MPPRITQPVFRMACDDMLRASASHLARAYDSPPAVQDLFWEEATLPLSLGGLDVGGHADKAPYKYAAKGVNIARDVIRTNSVLTDERVAASVRGDAGGSPYLSEVAQLYGDIRCASATAPLGRRRQGRRQGRPRRR